jgi:hypothetical protein
MHIDTSATIINLLNMGRLNYFLAGSFVGSMMILN